jgi:hypothetical protein
VIVGQSNSGREKIFEVLSLHGPVCALSSSYLKRGIMKLTLSRPILFGGFLVATIIFGLLILRDHNPAWKQFLRRNAASEQQGTSTVLGEGAVEGEKAPGYGSTANWLGGRTNNSDRGNAAVLLEQWLAALSIRDGSENPLSQQIIESLHTNPDGNSLFYQQAQQILEDASIDVATKQALIWIMDRAATPAAINRLAEWCQPSLPIELRTPAYRAIADTGQYFWDEGSLSQAIPILQQLWARSDDPGMFDAVGTALSRIGNSESVNFLLDAVLSAGNMAEIEHSSDPRVSAAWLSLQRLGKPELIPFFQEKLQSSTSLLEASVCAGLLGGMEQTDALQALLSWARTAGDEYAPVAQRAFARIGTSASLQYINSALTQNSIFKSSLVRSTVLSAIRK